MMTGTVNAALEGTLLLTVFDNGNHSHVVPVFIDTGFTGELTLPPAFVAVLGLLWIGRQHAMLADGTVQIIDVYAATVMWDGRQRHIEVDAVNAHLLGMSMLENHELRIEVVSGGNVTVLDLP